MTTSFTVGEMTPDEQDVFVRAVKEQQDELRRVVRSLRTQSADHERRADAQAHFTKGLDAGVAIGFRLAADWIERAMK